MRLFDARTVRDALDALKKSLGNIPVKCEEVPLLPALNRVLAEDVYSSEDIPAFDRSTVDGYAVMARDTFGAGESIPALLKVVGEIRMGERPEVSLKPGQAMKISTGGMLPEGSDAVVMLEYTQQFDDGTLVIERPVAPGENVIFRGEDVKKGSLVLPKGHTLRPQDLAALAGIGRQKLKVAVPPVVAVISTGDEIRPPGEKIKPGEIRDMNTYSLAAQVQKWGGIPRPYGVVRDDFDELCKVMVEALANSDMVVLSGGSSVGTRDLTVKVIESLGEPGVVVHGLAVKPGKPTILGAVMGRPVVGLPGHPVSAMVIFELVVRPLIFAMLGRPANYGGIKVRARIARNIASAAGREDFIRVKLEERDGELWAKPILGKSGLISTMVESDGLARIPPEKLGVGEGEYIEVELY
ncbi:gephyrin-like molybdotransferase Glp [Thermosediminibacter litoriperuensis]|uniref:Molybdopterin molybdenumtransferase n=1 Tax=Thermosediminibacter litoriperuensis TaxID=291989 RepID=A0A5S5ARC7_9FIRM|nr:gephyrin-like molybdotransferase Glp [Thermosediminibacter litoriperuensis]TYP54242.1 molybdopterin molybdochelatase [Thermosediminibacter litoriperuensis]